MLADLPLAAVLVGLTLYVVLGGADFGAGVWHLLAGRGDRARRLRDHAHHSIGPVWEANHVWLIFALTVLWTAYPVAFGSIASTLAVPLFVAALGIIARGTAYALRSGTRTPAEQRIVDTVTGIASLVTPLALGAAAGAIASGRVPVGNAAGPAVSDLLHPTPVLVAVLAVAVSAYMAAVFLAADAHRAGDAELERAFRVRALIAAGAAGALAIAGLIVVHADVPHLAHGLLHGDGRLALVASIVAGLATMALVAVRSYALARVGSAVAVAAVVAGWALAQRPDVLPGLTIQAAAAPRSTLLAVTVAIVAGAALLVPALWALFSLVLAGRFDNDDPVPAKTHVSRTAQPAPAARVVCRWLAVALVGTVVLVVTENSWGHALGIVLMLGAAARFVPLLAHLLVDGNDHEESARG